MMKVFTSGIFLFLLLFSSDAYSQVVCDKFEVNAKLNNQTFTYSLETDLPDSTLIMVSIYRVYKSKNMGEIHNGEYYSAKRQAGQLKYINMLMLDEKKWISERKKQQLLMAKLGEPFEVGDIEDEIVVSMVVPINQTTPIFGKGNKNLTGKMVNDSDGMRIIRQEQKLHSPMKNDYLNNASSKHSLDPMALETGVAYQLAKKTPLMPSPNPKDKIKALGKMKYIKAGTTIKILKVNKLQNNPWYKVVVYNSIGENVGQGWINGLALLGQDLIVNGR